MGYATADVGEGRRARASRLPVVDRICSSTLERARFPGPAPLVDTSIFPVPVPNGGERVAILARTPHRSGGTRAAGAPRRACGRPAGGWGPAAVVRRRTQNGRYNR
jgi:hypothetical protein